MKALEFYSGIGGLHLALSRSNVPLAIAHAFDWDQNACEVYSSNFGPGIATKVMDISTLTASYLAPIHASLWLLSPACQPYTVLNPSAKGELDPRAKSFLHLVQNILPELASQNAHPTHFLVENVGGFETSSTREILVSTLRNLGYVIAEFLLTPLQFGIPNSRLRYYLLAKTSALGFRDLQDRDACEILRHIPGRGSKTWVDLRLLEPKPHSADPTVHEIRKYLDSVPVEGYTIPDKILRKWGRLFDIVLPSSRRTCCFTRGYTQLVERSGSILQMNEEQDTTTVFDAFLQAQSSSVPTDPNDAVRTLDTLQLRYFTPEELLRLFSFTPPLSSTDPPNHSFIWPDGISRKTKYRLIGNSVNVKVVQELISYLFEEP
ncbi:S-adenosyl-L-methionine-dependent methyltransferase [Mycena epipterygia]|nr:S-adenosyl-L-methionine-dependent methyltransferase [Mycena epipterygia]